jgi:hypothetical protein
MGDVKQVVRVLRVAVSLCELCLDGVGGECHVPGCALWMKAAPDVPLNRDLIEVLTLDGELLEWSEAYARERGVSWTAVVEAGLRELQASAMVGVPDVGPGPVECEECGKTPRACWLPPHLCSHPGRLNRAEGL